ncbi:hypothetical protein [Microbacterium sp. GCS4]|uniref:hypothetical protein n=1 Tax=Microbacterium sp. GCS4 TaxID=1692239 RepID=UPI00068173E3|nr:hypothetical protein [Microbacterium sp. GCS4]KNY06868.1 hypothetical protein AKH00_00560 [Microbacterium sp. GCS4]
MTTITHSAGVITPTIVDGYRASRAARTIVHRIIGRPDPDVSYRPASLRSGQLTCVFAVEADAHAAEAVFSVPQPLTLNDTDVSIGMTFIVPEGGSIEVELDDETRDVWLVRVDFEEVVP